MEDDNKKIIDNNIDNNNVVKKKKKKPILLLFLKKNKLKSLLLLFIALLANTYAWFVYNRVVSTNLEAHVKSWRVSIDGAVEDSLTFEIDDLYPGMPEYSDQVTLTNEGEIDANIEFSIHKITIMGDTYELGVDGETLESLNQRLEGYPFTITLESSSQHLTAGGGETTIRLYVNWDFGDGDPDKDALDTYWGEKSYEFTSDNPGVPSLELVVDVSISQDNG